MSVKSTADDLNQKMQAYREERFTGVIKVSAQKEQWLLFSLVGRIVWSASRTHALRRWKRHIAICIPPLSEAISRRKNIAFDAWNYTALTRLVKLGKISQNQLSNVAESIVTEDLFDILQVAAWQQSGQGLTYECVPQEVTSLPFVMMNCDRAWREARDQWSRWTRAGFGQYSPDWGLSIQDFESLRLRASPQTLQTLKACCNPRNTLRDLAVQSRQSVIFLTQSLLPYVSEQMLRFTELPDLASGADHGFSPALVPAQPVPAQPVPGSQVLSPQRPRKNASGGLGAKPAVRGLSDVPTKVIPPRSKSPKSVQQRTVQQRTVQQHISSKPLFRASVKKKAESSKNSISPNVVYIDDSPADSRTMAQVVEGLGCRYTNIADPIQALPILLELNPDLIFLDLVMPVANGYEVCSQIRRISALKKTPVIIVTSNDGVADRVRARLVGASGFLGKPIRSEKVAKVLKKHVAGFRPHASVKPMQKPTEKGKSTQENTQKNVPKNTQEGAQKSAPESTPENTQRVGASLISR